MGVVERDGGVTGEGGLVERVESRVGSGRMRRVDFRAIEADSGAAIEID